MEREETDLSNVRTFEKNNWNETALVKQNITNISMQTNILNTN